MVYRVFSQASPDDEAGEARLVQTARAHFAAALSVRTRHIRGDATPARREQLTVTLAQKTRTSDHTVTRRAATEDDWRAADEAEVRGRAGGMATLARRCRWLWEIEANDAPAGVPASDEQATLTLCAIVAATELGPVLPPNGDTLYGVRGARERAERLA